MITVRLTPKTTLFAGLVACAAGSASAHADDLVLSDLATHTLTTTESRQIVLSGSLPNPYFSPGDPATTLEVLPGGDAAGGVITDGVGRIHIFGGTVSGPINTPYLGDFSVRALDIDMTSGSFVDAGLDAGNVNISGGTGRNLSVGFWEWAAPSSGKGQLTMTGGTLDRVYLSWTGRAELAGGTVNSLIQEPLSRVTISGATVGSVNLQRTSLASQPQLLITGGTVGAITAPVVPNPVYITVSGGNLTGPITGGTFLELHGTEFSLPFGTYPPSQTDHITGILADGSPLDLHFSIWGGNLVLKQAPEPGTLLLLAPGALLMLRRRAKGWKQER